MIQPKLYKLSNGIPVIIDHLPGSDASTVGVYVESGSRNESAEKDFGISHLLEHMALKGTAARSARDITVAIEEVGGSINAYTSFNLTSYYATVPGARIGMAAEILADVAQNPSFPENELEKEKMVVAQEIMTYEDIPEAVLESAMCDSVFTGGMKHNIAGSLDSVREMTGPRLAEFFRRRYSAKNSVIALSGGGLENPDEILAMLEANFGGWAARDVPGYEFSAYSPALRHIRKSELSHTYFKLVWPTRPAATRGALAGAELFLTVLGGGFGSRLFQEIREKRGLVYGIGAASLALEDVGVAIIEGQTDRKKIAETIGAVAEICNGIKSGGTPLTPAELARAKEMTKGALLTGLESSMRRADFFAARSVQFGGLDNLRQNMDLVDSITLEQAAESAREIFAEKPSVITLGVENELPLADWQKMF